MNPRTGRSLIKVLAGALLVITTVGCAVKPSPLTEDEIRSAAQERFDSFTANQEAVTRPITLYEAMARAIKYNLDLKVEMVEEALRTQELRESNYEWLMPRLVGNLGYQGRANFSGASSSTLLGRDEVGAQSLVASTSAERDFFANDLNLSWNMLDFGLSYVRSNQAADQALIAGERRRRVINRIVEDVRTAFFRALTAQNLENQLLEIDQDINVALQQSEDLAARRNVGPLTALTSQRELLRIREDIQSLQSEFAVAKRQLASLINLGADVQFTIAEPPMAYQVDIENHFSIPADPVEMIEFALRNRPELREISYRERINRREANAALLEILPSLNVFGGFNYNSNDFLFNKHWTSWGSRVSWNLVEAFRYPSRRKTLKAQDALLDQRAKALTMAVVTQVHISRTRFELARRRVENMRRFSGIQDQILDKIRASYETARTSAQHYLREQMSTVIAEAKYNVALSDLYNAFANIHASMGVDPIGTDRRSGISSVLVTADEFAADDLLITGDETVAVMACKLREQWEWRTIGREPDTCIGTRPSDIVGRL